LGLFSTSHASILRSIGANAIRYIGGRTDAQEVSSLNQPEQLIPIEIIEHKILVIRGHKVMLDRDLAELYQVPTKVFNQTVKRNLGRFPGDFMFQLTKHELGHWRSHFVTSNPSSKMGLRRRPYAFTEHGVAMLSSLLNSQRAIQMNILIIRTFVKIREMQASNKDLAYKIEALENQQIEHGHQLAAIYTLVKQMIAVPRKLKKSIGFAYPNDKKWGNSKICKESTNS
jgi:hypothetical protein